MWLEGLIQEDADVLCPLLVQEVDTFQLCPHLENINDVQVEGDTLYTLNKECGSAAIQLLNRPFAMHRHV